MIPPLVIICGFIICCPYNSNEFLLSFESALVRKILVLKVGDIGNCKTATMKNCGHFAKTFINKTAYAGSLDQCN